MLLWISVLIWNIGVHAHVEGMSDSVLLTYFPVKWSEEKSLRYLNKQRSAKVQPILRHAGPWNPTYMGLHDSASISSSSLCRCLLLLPPLTYFFSGLLFVHEIIPLLALPVLSTCSVIISSDMAVHLFKLELETCSSSDIVTLWLPLVLAPGQFSQW